jgi:hypothetical protein
LKLHVKLWGLRILLGFGNIAPMAIEVHTELNRQRGKWQELFNTRQGFDVEDYTNNILPIYLDQPPEFKGQFDNPYLVLNRPDLAALIDGVKVMKTFYLAPSEELDRRQLQEKRTEEVIWVDFGAGRRESITDSELVEVTADSRTEFLSIRQALSICLHSPDLLNDYALVCGGSIYRSENQDFLPFIYRQGGEPTLNRVSLQKGHTLIPSVRYLLPIKGIDPRPIFSAPALVLWSNFLDGVSLDPQVIKELPGDTDE